MENLYDVVTSDHDVFREALLARELYPRNDTESCFICDTTGKLACDSSCIEEDGFECKWVVKVDNCRECPTTKCVESGTGLIQNNVTVSDSSSGPSVGVIIGAVIGGIVGIAAATFIIWWFCIRNKRQPTPVANYNEVPEQKVDSERSFQDRRDQRSSMHTVHSIASTVLTRASNIIQIAYIPGVTNRATPTSPNVLVPPVPPIPISVSSPNTPASYEDDHFFMPGDLRDSTYSAMSGYTDRTSMARTSYAPRSSVASTLYGKNVVVSTPQTAMMVRPGVVSVRTGPGSSGSATPPVPNIDYDKYNQRNSKDSYFSIGDALTKKVAAKPVQARVVRASSGKAVDVSSTSRFDGQSSIPNTPAMRSPLAHGSPSTTVVEDDALEGPFSDPPADRSRSGSAHTSDTNLSADIEEATRRAAHIGRSKKLSRESSPFSDSYATKD